MIENLDFLTGLDTRTHREMGRKVRDCLAGEERIKRQGERYLFRPEAMTPHAYQGFLRRASFLNVVRPTLAALLGSIFRKPTIAEFHDERLPFVHHNVEREWEELAEHTVGEVLITGRVLLLVDPLDTIDRAASRVKLYCAESIIDHRMEDGRLVSVTVEDSKCEDGESLELRIGEGGYYEAAWLDADGNERAIAFPQIGGKRLAYLPVVFINPTSPSPCLVPPPLLDLTNRSLAFFQLHAEYRQALYFTASPQPVAVGFSPQELPQTIGPSTIISSKNPAAKFTFATYAGSGLGEMRAALADLKAEMAGLGASMLLPKSQSNVAARTVELRQREDSSVAASVVGSVENGLRRVMSIISDWEQREGDVSISINRDLVDTVIDANLLKNLRDAYVAGTISWTTWIEALQRGEIIPVERSAEDERNLIETDPFHGDAFAAAGASS